MTRFRWGFIYLIIFIFTDFSMASVDSGIDKEVMELFEINWESMQYDRSVTINNPEVASNPQPSRAKENLTLRCKVEIKDPNLVLGISRKGFLTEMTDSKGQNIEIDQQESESRMPPMPAMRSMPMNIPRNMPSRRSMEMAYEGLRYRPRMTQPPKVPRWKALLFKYFRVPQKPFKPVLVNQLEPSRLQFELDLGLLSQSGGEIKNLKGYYYALMAESVEYIEVPFEPNDQWVRLTDDVAIKVKEAECKTSGSAGTRYNFEIEESQSARRGMPGLAVGDYLPEMMVTGRQFIRADGEPHNPSMGFGFLPAHVGGSGSGSGSGGPVEKIRFVIAVNPQHYKIPFELKNIPLPNPESTEETE